MPHYEVPLDEFLESANEAVLSQKKTVNELLAKAERVLTKKIKTKGDASDVLTLINSEGQKFNDCLKILAAAHTKYESGKMSKEDFNETTKNAIVLLKKNCSNLQIKLGNVVSDTKAVTAKDIADFKEYLTGLKKIVNNRLKYLNSMPASESVFNDNDEENFSRHWIFAKEGDGSEDIEMDDPLGSDDDKDKDEDDDDKKKSKKSKSKKESDSDDDEDDDKDDDKKSKSKKKDDDDDKDDSESGFADGEDPDDKKSDDSDDDDDKKDKDDDDKECDDDECDDKDCKKSKSKKKSDDDDKDDESESKESATFNTVLENFVKNTSDYGKEAALETFFSDCEYLSSINPSNKDEAIAKENATMMLNNRRNNEEVTMESISIVSALMDNYLYNCENFGVDAANERLASDVSYQESAAMEGNADAPIYNGGAAFVGGPGFNTPGQYTMQRYSTGDWVSNAIDARLSNDACVARDTCASINKSDAKKMAAIANKMTKLNSKKKTADDAKKKTKIDAKLRKLKLSADAINETRKTMGMNPLSFESALAAYNANDPAIAAYEAVLDEIISRVDDYDFDEAMEGSDKFIMSPGKYNINKSTSSDETDYKRQQHWVTNAFANRVNPDNLQGRLDYKYAEKSDKKDIKKMAAAAKKIEKLKIKAAKETNPKKLAQIKVQIKKLGVVASFINNARKKAGLDPIAFEAAISANINVFDGSFRAYDEALEMLINTEDDLSAEFCDLDYED